MNRCAFALYALPLIVIACSSDSSEPEQNKSAIQAAPPCPPPETPETVHCGDVTCGEGQVCCNASCGICTAPNEGCIKMLCNDENPPPPAPCKKTGCSGQICSDQDLASTCEWQPEYACYANAACERQPDGQCGFTPSAALTQCLADNQ